MSKPVTMKRRAQRPVQENLAPTPKKGKTPLSGKKGQPSLSGKKGKPSPSGKKRLQGGILANITNKYTSFVVEIRPSKWKKNKIWIGQLKSYEDAQQVADAAFFYIGKPPFHIKDVVRDYPSITCMGIVLSTSEECAKYVSAIAKGDEWERQRKDFTDQVKGVLRRPEFGFLRPDHGVVSPNRDEVEPAEVPPKGDGVEQVEEEGIPAMEDDENAAMACRMSSNGVPAVVRPGSGSFAPHLNSFSGVHLLLAYIPGFDVQPGDSASNLRSVGQSIGTLSLPDSMDDRSTSQDEEWKQWIVDDPIAAGASTSTVVSDAEVHHQEP